MRSGSDYGWELRNLRHNPPYDLTISIMSIIWFCANIINIKFKIKGLGIKTVKNRLTRKMSEPKTIVCSTKSPYAVTFSSHLTIPSITPIEMRQKPANTAQHIHCWGKVLSIVTPMAMKRLPIAVADNHKPWQIPCK